MHNCTYMIFTSCLKTQAGKFETSWCSTALCRGTPADLHISLSEFSVWYLSSKTKSIHHNLFSCSHQKIKERKKSQNTLIQQNWFLFCVISPDKFVGIITTFNLHDSLHSIIHLQVLVLFPTFHDSPVLVLFPAFHDSPVLVLFPAFHDSPVLVLFPAFHDSPVLVLFPAFHDSPVLVLFPAFHDSPVLVLFPAFHDSPVLVLFPTFHDLNSNLSLSFVPSLPSMIQRATCPPHLYECASQHCHPGNAGSVWNDQTSEASLKPNKKDLVLPLGDQIY